MKKSYILLLALPFVFYTGCVDIVWEPIFNGVDMHGWEVKSKDADAGKNYWYVEDSCIVANSMGDSLHDYIWLQYNEELENFYLRFKFQPYHGNKGNSGVQIWSRYDEDEQWLNGPQVDIHPSGPWRTGMVWDETRGYQRWIFPDLPDGKWVDPGMTINMAETYYAGMEKEWNEMMIMGEAGSIKTFLNGVQVTDFDNEVMLKDSIHLAKGVGSSGFLLLQIHTRDQLKIRFKDIELARMYFKKKEPRND